jgi:cell division septal protein FtsQ
MKVFKLIYVFVLSTVSFGIYADEQIVISASEKLKRVEMNGQVSYSGDELILQENERLVFDEPSTVFLDKLEMKESSTIDTKGK